MQSSTQNDSNPKSVTSTSKSKTTSTSTSTSVINGMDDNNNKALHIMNTQGIPQAMEFMFQHPTETTKDGKPRQMSYSEMRMYYG